MGCKTSKPATVAAEEPVAAVDSSAVKHDTDIPEAVGDAKDKDSIVSSTDKETSYTDSQHVATGTPRSDDSTTTGSSWYCSEDNKQEDEPEMVCVAMCVVHVAKIKKCEDIPNIERRLQNSKFSPYLFNMERLINFCRNGTSASVEVELSDSWEL